MWSMVTGSSPFKKYKSKNQNINFASILISGERDTIPPYTPPELTQLIKKCWDGDPSVRPDFSQIIEELYLMKCPYRDVYFCRLYEGLLPDDLGRVLKKIASNLPKKDKINLSRVCKQFYRILQKKPSL
uniref:Protein kinase domain-containing protein n=1 Tax=Arcella intermedia TaxID=1963864 RepID=A0A6B2LNW0_9EUKA